MKKLSFVLLISITIFLTSKVNYQPQAGIFSGDVVVPPSISSEMPIDMVGYFKNLKENFGQNEMGTCSYVAIGMLLSYYDTFYNDDIIPEQYDTASSGNTFYNMKYNSPGIRKESLTDTITTTDYYNEIIQYQNTHFQSQLILLGRTLNYSLSMNGDNIKQLLMYYTTLCLQNIDLSVNFLGGNHVNNNTSELVREYIIESIQAGRPVIVGGIKDTIFNHTFIAYDYDEDTDTIYGHMGWDENDTYVDFESIGYTHFNIAVSLQYEDVHKCSDNYEVYGISACPCGYIESHNHYIGYNGYITIPLDNYAHRYYCYCGYNETTSHNYTYIINKGYYKCNECLHISNVSIGINAIVPKKEEE